MSDINSEVGNTGSASPTEGRGGGSGGVKPAHTPCLTYDDPREISGIYFPGEDGGCHRVGQLNVSRIVAYREHGQGDYVPYFAVYKGDDIAHRVPGWMVEVAYALAKAEGRS